MFTVHIEACHGGLGGAFMQKDAQRNDRILAYGNRTLHMPERNFSSFRNGLPGGIFCFEHNVDETYLQTLPSYQTLKDWKVGTLAIQFEILLKLPQLAGGKKCILEAYIYCLSAKLSKYYSFKCIF